MKNINFNDFPGMISAVQFGSSVSGDSYAGSDIDLLVLVSNKKAKEKIGNALARKLNWKYQAHIYSLREFSGLAKKGEPLVLSIVHTGKVLFGHKFIDSLTKYMPNQYTIKKCMLNSFAALGLGLSDLISGVAYDSINSFYHAARSSIWATLMEKEITPPNRRVFELLEDNKVKLLYKQIVDFRNNIHDYKLDTDFDKKFWKNGDFNKLTALLRKVNEVIRINYRKTLKQRFVGCFELMGCLRKRYAEPEFYSIMLSVNWEKMLPHYNIFLSYKEKRIYLIFDAHSGRIKKVRPGLKDI